MKLRHSISIFALAFATACSQGSDIASPGPTGPTSPPGGGGTGGGGGGGGTASCPDGFAEGTGVGGLTTCNITGQILGDLVVPAVDGVAYRIDGRIDVGSDVGADGSAAGADPATLTIEPGVTLFGESGSDFMVVNRGSRLIADGEVSAPIIMTSADDLARQADDDPGNDDGGDSIGEWGGLVILGQAPINRCRDAATPGTVDCENVVEGVTNPQAFYGGADANDDSGTLRYFQIRFAGFAINADGDELNGITAAGLGDGTTLDFVQVHNNADDGIEFFGGTANAKHIILTGMDDDSLDTDNGWQGALQYLIVRQREEGGDNIVEASSVEPGVAPLSNANVSNFTFVGNRSNAFRFNSGTVGRYVNGVVAYGQECFRYQDSAGDGEAGFTAGADPSFDSVLFDCEGGLATENSDTAAAEGAIAAGTNISTDVENSLASTFFPGPSELAVTPFDASTLDPFLEATDYVGAFGPDDTETNNWAFGWSFSVFPDPECPVGTTDSGFDLQGQNVCEISGQILDNVRLTRGNFYEITGRIDVGLDVGADGNAPDGDPASLTIESGVTVFGDSGEDFIVINRGSQLFANGTRDNPVIMTSRADVTDSQADPINAIGEWGGLVILGRAPINRCRDAATPGTVDCENVVEGVTNPQAFYGGDVADDDSGSLTFLQLRHAGFAINADGDELNGITAAGLGSETTLEHIQVHNNADDGIEFFGGRANARYIVLTGMDDDSLDTDNGWQGALQFLIVVQRELGGDNVVEASSVEPGVAPLSNANVSNFTFVGNRSNAFRFNSGTVGTYVNGVVAYGQECFRYQDSAGDGVAGFTAGADPSFESVLFDCEGGLATDNSDTAAAEGAIAAGSNITTDVADTLTGTFINGTAETAATPFDASTLDPFLETTDYIGAVKDANDTWWEGWTCGLVATDQC
jgi:trimeric autotransporter adhesin